MVRNLVSNAIKFTPAGGSVIIKTAREKGRVKLVVHDTGEGVAPEILPYAFDR